MKSSLLGISDNNNEYRDFFILPVLAIDPDDTETQDFKIDSVYFQKHPDKFDPSQVYTINDDPPAPRKILRSVSERRPMRRKAIPGAGPQPSSTSGFSFGFPSETRKPSVLSASDDVFDGNNNSDTVGEMDGEKLDQSSTPRLQRSQSESVKRPTSVLAKIKRFEARKVHILHDWKYENFIFIGSNF